MQTSSYRDSPRPCACVRVCKDSTGMCVHAYVCVCVCVCFCVRAQEREIGRGGWGCRVLRAIGVARNFYWGSFIMTEGYPIVRAFPKRGYFLPLYPYTQNNRWCPPPPAPGSTSLHACTCTPGRVRRSIHVPFLVTLTGTHPVHI